MVIVKQLTNMEECISYNVRSKKNNNKSVQCVYNYVKTIYADRHNPEREI